VIAVIFALLAAACNAVASVCQRRAASSAPPEEAFRLALIWDLLHRKWWLLGVAGLIGGFLCQAAALAFGELALVQPLLVIELPFTMLLGVWMFHGRLDRPSWWAIIALTAGIAVFLGAAGPGEVARTPTAIRWIVVGLITAGVVGLVVLAAVLIGTTLRGTLLGVATGLGFAMTAALIKESTQILRSEPLELLTTWPLYAMIGTGVLSMFLLENTYQSGNLVAVQPALTISDPIASIALGVALFGESIRTDVWIIPELAGIGLILYGTYLMSHSRVARRGLGPASSKAGHAAQGDG
jgi:drug/metabolite transporter (DMT)-like permease